MGIVNPIQYSNLKRINEASQKERLVIFVGAGVSKNSKVPLWGELIERMKQELPETFKFEKDDLKLAQIYKDSRGDKEYLELIMETLMHNKVIPNPIHREILELNPAHIITTNYDDLLEQQIQKDYKQFSIVRSDKDIPKMNYPNALIKMHGDFETGNIVLAENDYYNYSKNFALTRAFVQSLFASKLILFIGFSFNDLNLKMILNDVKNILDERMQPVYLISLDKPDDVTKKYIESKGIRAVYLTDTELQCLLPNNIDKSFYESLDENGIRLLKYLKILKDFDTKEDDDLILHIYNKISSYEDEIKVFGSGLKYFFPKTKEEIGFHEHSGGLQTFSKTFDNISKDIKSFSGKKAFILKYGSDKCRSFTRIAYYNYLHTIDGLKILGENFWVNIERYIPSTINDSLEEFDYNSFQNRLRMLSSRQLNGTIADLEYPYAYYKIGSYFRAYQEYDKILPIAWKRQKYILYFLCLYNMWSLRYAIKGELTIRPREDIDWKPIYKRLSEINLQEILSKLPLPKEIRLIFQDLLANKYASDHVIESENLKEKIHQQRIVSEKGGTSINSNISSLIEKYQREILFGQENFILSDFNKINYALCRNTISGILNSLATKDDPDAEFRNSKIDSLGEVLLKIIIFGIDNKDLRAIFRQFDIYNLEINIEGENYIIRCISKLKDGIFLRYKTRHTYEAIKNLLYIIARCEQINVDSKELYDLVQILWNQGNERFELNNFLALLISNHNPTPDIAMKILKMILDDATGFDYNDIVRELCKILRETNHKLDTIENYLSENLRDLYLLPLYSILDVENQSKLMEFGKTSFKRWFPPYVEFMHKTGFVPDDIEDFKKRISKGKDSIEGNNAIAAQYLAEWRKDEKYKHLWDIIDEQQKKDSCLQFFYDPFNYKDPDNVKVEWLISCPEKTVKKLIKNPIYKEKIKHYIAETKMNPHERLQYLSVF